MIFLRYCLIVFPLTYTLIHAQNYIYYYVTPHPFTHAVKKSFNKRNSHETILNILKGRNQTRTLEVIQNVFSSVSS